MFCETADSSFSWLVFVSPQAVLRRMPGLGIRPSVESYSIGLTACAKGGRWQEALVLLREMEEDDEIKLDVIGEAVERQADGHTHAHTETRGRGKEAERETHTYTQRDMQRERERVVCRVAPEGVRQLNIPSVTRFHRPSLPTLPYPEKKLGRSLKLLCRIPFSEEPRVSHQPGNTPTSLTRRPLLETLPRWNH